MKRLFKPRCIALIMAVLATITNVNAQLSADSPWVLEVEGTYEVTAELFEFKDLYATFTAPSDGVLSMSYVGTDELSLYTDATYAEFAEIQPEWQGSFSPKVFFLDVKEGVTYYFHRSFIMNYGTITIEFGAVAKPLELKSVYPVEGAMLHASDARLSVEFNKPVSYGATTLSVGDVKEMLVGNGMMNLITYDVKAVLMKWYGDGVLKKGDEVTLTISDVCNSVDAADIYGTDGTFTQKFTVASMPIQLIGGTNLSAGIENPMTEFLSYYMNPTLIQMQFDGAISLKEGEEPIATITFGDMESDYYYSETISLDCSEAGNGLISMDISGKLRRMVDMIPNYAELEEDARPTIVVVSINNVHGVDGGYAYSSESGSLGSYAYEYTFKELKNDIVSDFVPAIGAKFEGVKSIELYVRGEKELQYDGVNFIYLSGGEENVQTVSMSEIVLEPDMFDEEAMILTIPVPEFTPDAGSIVTVTLANLRSSDGLDYSSDLTAVYKVDGAGIEQVTGRKEKITVFSLNGVRLMKDADKASLSKLRRGIYIINGEKRAVR